MAAKIRIRRGTSAQWAASSRILDPGELGLDLTVNKLKAGDGINLWSALPFINILPSELSELAQDAVETALTAGTGITKTYNDNANTITLAVNDTIANKTYVDTAVSGLSSTSATTYIPLSLLGNADGVAELDQNGFVPDAQIPAGITRDTELSSAISTEITDRNTAIATAKSEAIADATSQVSALITGAPAALNTLDELAAALGDDANYAATITTALGTKAPIASPTFTGTVSGIDKTMVGLGNVDNTTDALKPISTATQNALDLKLNLSEPSIDYYVTNSGSGSYLVNGTSNSLISFEKGKKYRIHVNATGHPFWIQTVSGAYSLGNVYSTGVTNNGAEVGHIIVELPQAAPDNLYYACQYHSSMAGSISVQSADSVTINSKAGNYTISPIDSGRLIEIAGAGTVTITDSTSFPIGFTVDVLRTGDGTVNIAGNGFTPNSTPGLTLRTKWSSATLIKRALNSWVVLGDLAV
jgi:hypothetical protein